MDCFARLRNRSHMTGGENQWTTINAATTAWPSAAKVLGNEWVDKSIKNRNAFNTDFRT